MNPEGLESAIRGINRVWFNPELGLPDSGTLTKEDYKRIGMNPDILRANTAIPKELEEMIQKTEEDLRKTPARVVVLETGVLKGLMWRWLEGPQEVVTEDFYNRLRKNVIRLGFIFLNDYKKDIEQNYQQDCLNLDVPIFYYNIERGEILYHDTVIGRRLDLRAGEESAADAATGSGGAAAGGSAAAQLNF